MPGAFFAPCAGRRWPRRFFHRAMISGIGSIYYTSVADAMVIYATVPFVTAGVAYVFIRERPSMTTLVASAVAFLGVLVMLSGECGRRAVAGSARCLPAS